MPSLITVADHRIAGMPPSQFIEACIVLACWVFAVVIIVHFAIKEDRDNRLFACEQAALEAAHQARMRSLRPRPTRPEETTHP